jgi:FXSXX-COOH protein
MEAAMRDVPGRMKTLSDVPLERLLEVDDPALPGMLDRVLDRMDRPGTTISGFNGAGGLGDDSDPDMSEPSH